MSSSTQSPRKTLMRLGRAVRWHRRGLGIALAAMCLLACLSVLAPAQPESAAVVVAAHDLASGALIGEGDVKMVDVPLDFLPQGALVDRDAVFGRTLSGAQTAGSILTHASLMGTRPGDASTDERLVPFRISDSGVVALLTVGDRITVVGSTSDGGAVDIATDVRVVALPASQAGGLGVGQPDALVVIATDPQTAASLAAAANKMPLSIVLR